MNGISRLTVGDESVRGTNNAESVLIHLIKGDQKGAEGRIGKRVEELDLIKPADEIDEGRERGHRGEGTKAVKGDRGSGMGHQMKEERGIKDEIEEDNVSEEGRNAEGLIRVWGFLQTGLEGLIQQTTR